MPMEDLPGDAELAAQVTDVGLMVGHGGVGGAVGGGTEVRFADRLLGV